MIFFGTVLASNREGGVGFDLHFRSVRCSWGVVVSLPWIYLTLPVRMTVLGHRLEMLVFKRQLQNTNLPLELTFQVCCRLQQILQNRQFLRNMTQRLLFSQLGNHCQVVSWRCHGRVGFGNKFLDPNVTAWDMMTRGIKRPAPFHVEPVTHDALEDTVEQRVIAKQTVEVKNFLQHIRDVPEKTWREEREAVWETAIRRWILLLEQWEAPEAPLTTAIQNKESFVEKAQIMVDVFYNKAPQTLMKRVNSLAKLCHSLHGLGVRFPCNEEEFYLFLKGEASRKAPASRLKAFFESLVFCRHVLGIESLQQVVCSRRCLGASASTALSCPRQAEPFSVPQLRKLHEVLRNGPELWDQMMSGMVLFLCLWQVALVRFTTC